MVFYVFISDVAIQLLMNELNDFTQEGKVKD